MGLGPQWWVQGLVDDLRPCPSGQPMFPKLLPLYVDVCLIVLLEAQNTFFWVLRDGLVSTELAMPCKHKGLNPKKPHKQTKCGGTLLQSRVAKAQTGFTGLTGHPAHPKDDTLGSSSDVYTHIHVHTCLRTLTFLQMKSMRCVCSPESEPGPSSQKPY